MVFGLTVFRPDWNDVYAGFNAQCAILGIGSLAMGRNFGQAGLWPGTLALIIMFVINACAQVALSRSMHMTPRHVQTFSDLGEYVAGRPGRLAALITQFGACLLIPIAFLVLGGAYILPVLFDNRASPNVFIPLMSVMLLPVVLIRTLKEGAWLALLGALGAVLGIVFAIVDSVANSAFYHDTAPKLEFESTMSVFGSMAMGFGSAVVIPAIQRDHPRPERMPTIIVGVLMFTALCYYAIGLHGHFQYGCVAPSNLLKAMSSRTWEIVAMSWFMIHIMIAYAVYLNPALFLFERYVFGFHRLPEHYSSATTPGEDKKDDARVSIGSLSVAGELGLVDAEEYARPFTVRQRIRSYTLRTTVVVLQTFLAMLLQSSFEDLCDFAGATCLTMSAMVLPLGFYLKISKTKGPLRVVFILMMLVCFLAGTYTAVLYMRHMFENTSKFALFSSQPPKKASVDTAHCKAEPRLA